MEMTDDLARYAELDRDCPGILSGGPAMRLLQTNWAASDQIDRECALALCRSSVLERAIATLENCAVRFGTTDDPDEKYSARIYCDLDDRRVFNGFGPTLDAALVAAVRAVRGKP